METVLQMLEDCPAILKKDVKLEKILVYMASTDFSFKKSPLYITYLAT